MKKWILGILLAFSAVTLAAGLAACDEGQLHSYGAWSPVPGHEATCTESGLEERVCTMDGCGEREERVAPALGHDWGEGTVTLAPTCVAAGEQVRTCTRCNEEQTFSIPAKGHDWDEGTLLEPARCTVEGKTHNTCLVCGAEADLVLPMLGHDYVRTSVTPATCEQSGKEIYTCTMCSGTEERTTAALGHLWENGDILKPADCVTNGLRELVCSRCETTQQVEIAALGHRPEGDFTIDVPPTFESAGEKSHHCTVCGERLDKTVIPQLNENVPIEYEFRLLRNNGEQLAQAVTVTVSEGQTKVLEISPVQMANGSYRAMLSPKTYTVTVSGLPEGYTAEESYAVTPFDPLCKLYVTAAPIAAPSSSVKYQVGSVMHDFTVSALNNTTGAEIKLSELLKSKRAVILNFWYVNCPNCVAEFQGLENVYGRYREKAEILAIDPFDGMKDMRSFASVNGLTFPMARDEAELVRAFGVTGYPTTVVIDGEGVVTEILVGATAESRFESLFAKYTADTYFVRAAEASLLHTQYLPGKRS